MKKEQLSIAYTSYSCKEEMQEGSKALIDAAASAANQAYAPYSGFRVGAALLLESGIIIRGNNQENAAYPSGLCAERVALFYANANYPNEAVLKIAVTAFTAKGEVERPVSPCGGCRQVLLETEQRYKKDIEVILSSASSVYVFRSAADLLPNSFDASQLLIK
jgi:cytidine deaminase